MAADDQTLISLLKPKKIFPKSQPKDQKEQPTVKSNFHFSLKKYWPHFGFLLLLVVIVYANSLDNGLTSDDVGLTFEGDNLKKLSYIFSDPLAWIRSLIYAVIYLVAGVNATLLRLLNIFFHLGNTWLVFMILSLMGGSSLGLIAASLFAVHPLQTESVTWISGGPYSQYTFFFLLSFLFYLLSKNSRNYYFGFLGSYLVALLSSNRVMTLFPIFYLYELLYGNLKKNWKKLVPITVLSLIWGIYYMFQIGGRQNSLQSQYYLEKGYDNPLMQIPYAISSYLSMFVWPWELTFYHSDLALSYLELGVRWVVLILFIGLWVFTFLRNKFLFFWLSFFIIGLLITLTPFRIAWVVAERYVYLSLLGLIVFVSFFLNKLVVKKKTMVLGWVLFGILVTLFSIRSMVRNEDWQSEKSLWTATVRTTPESPKAHNNLGVIYTQEKNYVEAEKELATAIRLKSNYGDAYHNLANLYRLAGKFDLALPLYAKALEINPNLYQSYTNLADIYFKQEKYEDSLKAMLTAQKLQPNEIDIYLNLAVIYRKIGKNAEAKEMVETALKLNPQDPRAQGMYQQLQTP